MGSVHNASAGARRWCTAASALEQWQHSAISVASACRYRRAREHSHGAGAYTRVVDQHACGQAGTTGWTLKSPGPAFRALLTHLWRVMLQATITSPEHLAAYADYCKRALSNAVNGPLLGKRDAVLHQVRSGPA